MSKPWRQKVLWRDRDGDPVVWPWPLRRMKYFAEAFFSTPCHSFRCSLCKQYYRGYTMMRCICQCHDPDFPGFGDQPGDSR